MSITLLAAVQQVSGESGFVPVPTSVVASGNDNVQWLYVANASVRTLRRWQWQKLIKFGTITLTTDDDYPLADDFWSYVPDTLWPDASARPADLPIIPGRWAQLKAGVGISSIAFNCRIFDNRLQVQNPEAGYVLNYEYISKNAIQATGGGTFKEAFTVDTDVCLLDEELFIRDLKWRWKKEKGIDDWEADHTDFENYRDYRLGVDAGAQTITPTSQTVFPEPYTDLWRP